MTKSVVSQFFSGKKIARRHQLPHRVIDTNPSDATEQVINMIIENVNVYAIYRFLTN